MRISAKAEYACVAMVELASRHQEKSPTSIKLIAESYGISQAFLMQIFLQLKGSSMVTSSRGAAGGYMLARAPEKISLAEVVTAIDGPPTATWALSGLNESPVVNMLKGLWEKIQDAEQKLLDEISLSDVLKQSGDSGIVFYQI